MQQYFVLGGVYTDTSFTEVVDGTAETHGPFRDYCDAYRVWRSRTQAHMDDGMHRVTIVKGEAT